MEKYPYTNYHELNLDWIIDYVQKITGGALTSDDIVQTLGGAADKVMSQKGVTASVTDLQQTFTELLAQKIDKSAVRQVIGTSVSDVMSQNAVTQAINNAIADIYRRNIVYYSTDGGATWRCSKSYADVLASSGNPFTHYLFYNGDQSTTKNYTEIFPKHFGNDYITFIGTSGASSEKQPPNVGTVSRISAVSLLHTPSAITVQISESGVDDAQNSRTDRTVSPSNRWVYENLVEYSDIESSGDLTLDSKKIPSSEAAMNTFQRFPSSGDRFRAEYSSSANAINLGGCRSGTKEVYLILSITNLPDVAAGTFSCHLTCFGFDLTGSVKLYNGLNVLHVQRLSADMFAFIFSGLNSYSASGERVVTNTSIPSDNGIEHLDITLDQPPPAGTGIRVRSSLMA